MVSIVKSNRNRVREGFTVGKERKKKKGREKERKKREKRQERGRKGKGDRQTDKEFSLYIPF